ncbi:hypothetical protein [Heyndrickxia vini]|nr:hypothetical protein [Heyndrickxia vini]
MTGHSKKGGVADDNLRGTGFDDQFRIIDCLDYERKVTLPDG